MRNSAVVELAMWRREVAGLYAAMRQDDDYEGAWQRLINGRNALFKEHPQTPLSAGARRDFGGLRYYPYDWRLRQFGRLNYEVEPQDYEVDLAGDGLLRYRRVATVHFRLRGGPQQLSLFWIKGYGGGLFLPFRDATNGKATFGGGRYLYDTIKGADLGAQWETMLLDFNYAYNPSCAYSSLWSCPLAPEENRLTTAIEAGELDFST